MLNVPSSTDNELDTTAAAKIVRRDENSRPMWGEQDLVLMDHWQNSAIIIQDRPSIVHSLRK
ncbi:hypothetical protein DAPPUDRAFT_343771 [Daphnia pulex]|uniref:Uncharacterized protein n=1 Tax=Daphnia pulex TaxID=6669 RepID=E9I6E0_DAPPU|nr:hypothetical protein DAPPUDRAFT_343771 [Daphnia pulex]|eukprot:EFX60440.1 hypothetical protein DAPPUDRAFT_343771 [Daphnia pulex]